MYDSNEARMSKVDKEYQESVVRLNALCRVYSQADRVLTGDPVSVHVVEDGPAPAWSDGKDVYINKSQIEYFDIEELVGITGLNYHELAHHLYTPRRSTTLVESIIKLGQTKSSPGYMYAFNALEDQRIETLIVGKYPAVVPYLTNTVVRWLANDTKGMALNYVCIRGRRYLPLDLRIAFRDNFILPHLIPVIADIVDKYRVLTFPSGYADALTLVQRFKEEVLDQIPGLDMNDGGGPNSCGARAPIKSGRPDTGDQQSRAMRRGAGIGDPEPYFEAPEPPEATDTNNNPEPEPEPEPFVAPKTPEEALAMRERAAAQRAADKARRTQGLKAPAGITAGDAYDPSVGGVPENIAEILSSISEDILTNSEVVRDVKAKQKAIIGNDKHSEVVIKGKFTETPVPLEVVGMARRFSRELEQLREACEPAWLREMPAGRVNVQRVIRGCEIDNAFDQWDDGDDSTNIEVVILVDRSGSMSSNNNDARASEACWVIKRSLDIIDVPTTVYAFDSSSELVFDGNSKANRTMLPFLYGQGGTSPEQSLISAERLMMTSRRKNKILFIITDGEFSHNPNDEIIGRLNTQGVTTVLMLISDSDEEQLTKHGARYYGDNYSVWHNAKIHGIVKSAADIFPFAKQIVLDVIKKSSRR